VKLPIKKLVVFFFRSTRIIRSISDSLSRVGPDNPCLAKKILIINMYPFMPRVYVLYKCVFSIWQAYFHPMFLYPTISKSCFGLPINKYNIPPPEKFWSDLKLCNYFLCGHYCPGLFQIHIWHSTPKLHFPINVFYSETSNVQIEYE
jgi:hypothetical protein